jgi:hypothetical protein
MNTFKKGLIAGATALAFSMSAQAGNINVGGVVWDVDSLFDAEIKTDILEAAITDVGDMLEGIGQVSKLNGLNTFCPTCELTFEFGGFELVSAIFNPISGESDLAFTDGWVNFYVQDTGAADFTAYDLGLDKTTANDGDLWLSLIAHENTASVISAVLGSLFGSAEFFGTGADDGEGSGLMDVITDDMIALDGSLLKGLANDNFDTNSKADNIGGFADFNFSSSFQPLGFTTPDGYSLTGTAELKGESIPEPSTIALLGLGLLGFAGARKRKA